MKNNLFFLLLPFILFNLNSFSQIVNTFQLNENTVLYSNPPSNSSSHSAAVGDTLWFGTSRGLTRTTDYGDTWSRFISDSAFMPHGIFSIYAGNGLIWTSTGYSKKTTVGSQTAGSGYTYSLDNGMTWNYSPQPIDDFATDTLDYGVNRIPMIGITTDVSNITYSVSYDGNDVWTASFAGGLRRSSDLGKTWERVILPPDNLNFISPNETLNFSLSPNHNLNHRIFSVLAASDGSLWVGSANGINISRDNGLSWIKLNAQNQLNGILGNWVIKIQEQTLSDGSLRIWTTSWRAEDVTEKNGVNFTDDHGITWNQRLHNIKAYDFAFHDDVVYVATENGIYRSLDNGDSWELSGSIVDRENRQRITTRETLTISISPPYIWVGTPEGIVRSNDHLSGLFGYEWKVFRTYESVEGRDKTYAYPNPFSPNITSTRLHYDLRGEDKEVTIEIFDFSMNRVRTVIHNALRRGDREHDEIWDGLDDAGRIASNGVYFYRINIDGINDIWGKVMVVK